MINPWLRRAFLWLLLAFTVGTHSIGGAGAQTAPAMPAVTDIRYVIQNGATRIVIEADRQLQAQATAANGPPRIVIDLQEVRWALPGQGSGRFQGLARAHRWGRVQPGASRLVVDLSRAGTVKTAFWIAPNRSSRFWRFIVDVDRGEPPAAAERPRDNDQPAVPQPRPPLRDAKPLIVIDAGHGGIDPGTVGVTGVLEKDLTLAMANELKAAIEAGGSYRVALTRADDRYIALRERIELARRFEGNLFISLHADSVGDRGTAGASVYTLSTTASDAEAERLAAKENKVDILAGTDLSHHDAVVAGILLDLAQRDTNNKSIEFADLMAEELGRATRLLRNTRRFAGFAVLKSPDIPSALVELGYLSNVSDAEKLADAAHRQRLARAIVKAVDRYFAALK